MKSDIIAILVHEIPPEVFTHLVFLLLDHRSNDFLGILHHLGDTQAHDEKKWVAKIKKHIMTVEEYITN